MLEAAVQMFVERGFHGASARQIAERAGFTNPVLYYHFGGKEELYQAVIENAFARVRAMVAETLAQAVDPLGRLRAIALAYLRFAIDDPVRLRVLFAELFRPDAKTPAVTFVEQRAWARQQIEAVLAECAATGMLPIADPPVAVQLYMALLGGLLLEQARDPSNKVLDESLADAMVQAVYDGIAKARRLAG